MDNVMKAIELQAIVENGQLVLAQPLPEDVPTNVRVIVMYEEGSPTLNALSAEAFSEQLRQRLAQGGYETVDEIGQLVHQVKEEQADEWGLG